MLNEETGKLDMLKVADDVLKKAISELEGVHHELVRVDGSVIPITAKIFKEGELMVIKDYTFRVVYISESNILLEPVRPEDALKSDNK